MCRLHSAASGPLKLADVMERAGLESKSTPPAPTKKEIIYSTQEVVAAREVLERLLRSPSFHSNADTTEEVVTKVTI